MSTFLVKVTSLFTNTAQHEKTLQSITDEYHRSDEQFVRAFKRKYSDPLPPSWMTLVSDTVFASWLHTLVYVRNICAHHARLWNRTLGVRPLMPRHPRGTFISQPATGTQRVYFVLTIIRYWLNIIDPQNTLTQDLQQLFSEFPSVHAGALGFPQNWEQESLWQ